MLLRDKILQHMRRADYVPTRRNELAEALKLNKKEENDLDKEIDTLLRKGYIARIKKNRLCIPQDANLVSGTIIFRQSGSAIVVRDPHLGRKDESPVTISAEDTWVAMHRDRVLVRLMDAPSRRRSSQAKSGGKQEKKETYGRVIRILERARTKITGTLQKAKLFYYVIPDDPRLVHDIIVPDPEKTSLKPTPRVGDKVVATLIEWKQRHVNPEGDLVEVLGRTHEPSAELKAIFRKFDLDLEFPKELEKEVAALPDSVGKKDLKGRLDLRQMATFTIDPDDSKDFDDALSIEKVSQGTYRVGIHIADVAAYVSPGTALDVEARRRGNSTYLIGTVVPMLPHKLSNGLCSLKEDEDRLTKSVLITLSKSKIQHVEFANSVIRSRKRLTYRQAYTLLKENDLEKVRKLPLPPGHQTGSTGRSLKSLSEEELKSLQSSIRSLWDLASSLRQKRMRGGSLDLDMPEVKIFVDEKGFADRIELIEYDESHQLIEEYMLLANEAIAKILKYHAVPAIYRVHDKPEEDKLNEFREYLAANGIRVGDLTNKKEVTKALQKIKEHPQGYTHRIQFLRSLKQAKYQAEPKGHYGLAKRNYTHFTSPIRRYADFVVHRIFENFLSRHQKRKPLHQTRKYTQADLEGIAEHLSITEQNSTEAEREHNKVKQLEFFERELRKKEKTRFKAAVTDIKNHGMFVELVASQTFGLVHISTMSDDHYLINGDGTVLTGKRTKKKFEIGQTVEVVTERVDRFKRQIDFRLAEMQKG